MTTSNAAEFKDWYLGLADADKMILLALVSSQLTIHGRAVGLDLSGEKQIMAFKGLNEIGHQISQHIVALGANHKKYPEDVFLRILAEEASSAGLSAHLAQSLQWAKTRDLWQK